MRHTIINAIFFFSSLPVWGAGPSHQAQQAVSQLSQIEQLQPGWVGSVSNQLFEQILSWNKGGSCQLKLERNAWGNFYLVVSGPSGSHPSYRYQDLRFPVQLSEVQMTQSCNTSACGLLLPSKPFAQAKRIQAAGGKVAPGTKVSFSANRRQLQNVQFTVQNANQKIVSGGREPAQFRERVDFISCHGPQVALMEQKTQQILAAKYKVSGSYQAQARP